MIRSIFTKTLYDKRFFIVGWSIGISALALIMLAFFDSFSSGLADALGKDIPAALKGFIGDINSFKEINSYIAAQFFDIRVPMLIAIMAVTLCVSISVGDEENGVLRSLSALPLSRSSLFLQQWLAMIVICLIVSALLFLSVVAGVAMIGQLGSLNMTLLFQIIFMTWLLMICLGSICQAIGAATGKRSLTTGIVSLIAFGSFFLTTFARNVDWLASWEHASILHYYAPQAIATDGISGLNIAVLSLVAIVSILLGIFIFRRRDIQ